MQWRSAYDTRMAELEQALPKARSSLEELKQLVSDDKCSAAGLSESISSRCHFVSLVLVDCFVCEVSDLFDSARDVASARTEIVDLSAQLQTVQHQCVEMNRATSELEQQLDAAEARYAALLQDKKAKDMQEQKHSEINEKMWEMQEKVIELTESVTQTHAHTMHIQRRTQAARASAGSQLAFSP